jgi:hypothetical protein
MSDHDEQCELRRAIDAIPVDCRCEARRLNARVAELEEAIKNHLDRHLMDNTDSPLHKLVYGEQR